MNTNSSNWSQDFLASIVVFLVALPLCLGIAIASGAPPAAGLLTGIVGGIVVGLLSGSPLQVSGPAAGLAVFTFQLIGEHGIAMLGPIVLLGGLMQLAAGLVKFGQVFRAIAPAVVHGMLAGIGVLIFGAQFHVMLDDKPRGNGLTNLASIPEAIYKGIFPIDGSPHELAAVIGVMTIAIVVAWAKFAPAKLKVLPAALLAVTASTIVAAIFKLPVKYVDIPEGMFGSLQFGSLDSLLHAMRTPALLAEAAALAFVASAETLLCATAVDKMHSGQKTNYDKELAAQGVGNALCGLLGALPMTGVIVRSGANVQAGGKTRLSAILHGAWLLLLVAAAPGLLRMIPTASLAALLVFTGYKLVNLAVLHEMKKFGVGPLIVYGATLVTIVATDLLTGIVAGLVLSFLQLIYSLTHMKVTTVHDSAGRVDVHIEGAATFVRLPKLADTLDRLPLGVDAHVHIQKLDYIDHACLDLLRDWEKQSAARGGKVKVEWDELMRRYQERDAFPAAPSPRAA